MRDVRTTDDRASEADVGPDDVVDLTPGDAEGHAGGSADVTGAASAGPPAGWLPRVTVKAATGETRWGTWGAVAVVALLLIAGGLMATRLPGGTTLAGAPVADVADAPAALDAAASALDGLRLTFTTDAGGRVELTGADLGLVVDRAASQVPLADGLPALGAWLRRPQGRIAAPLVATPLSPEALARVAAEVSTDPVNADVRVERADVEVTPGIDGLQVGPGQVDAGIASALATIVTTAPADWPPTLQVAVAGEIQAPAVTQADIDQAVALIEAFEQADVSLTAEVAAPPGEESGGTAVADARIDATIQLDATELRTLVEVEAVPDAPPGQRLRLAPNIEAPPSRVVALLESSRISPVLTASIENRSPTPDQGEELTDVSTVTGDVVPGEIVAPGFEPDRAATLAAVIEAGLAGGGEVRVTGGPTTTADPAALGIAVPVSTFTTFFPAGQSRVQNIQRIADLVDGTVIPAGETYELNHAVGERTIDNGFTIGGAIAEGELVDAIGGGVSQFATTFFNAAWFAGVELVDWKAHSIYFDRYPPGREATINYPNVNLEIRNDTPHAILVDTDHTESSITVTFWSTPWWQVQTIMGPCGCGGSFSITNERIRTSPDGAPLAETWSTTYTVPRPSDD